MDAVLPSAVRGMCGWRVDKNLKIGTHRFHHLTHAMAWARSSNKAYGRKKFKVVIDSGHFMVVDHTWERNT